MATVTIGTTDYDVYADVGAADDYLAAEFDATLWRAEDDDDQKSRALVSATRLLDRQKWAGDKEDEDQLHAFPRTGMGLADIDDDEIPQDIIDASIVLAKLIHSGSNVTSSEDSASNIKRQKAGSVEQEFFSPTLFEDSGRWPTEVLELIGRYLAGGGTGGTNVAFGTDGCSMTNETFGTTWPG